MGAACAVAALAHAQPLQPDVAPVGVAQREAARCARTWAALGSNGWMMLVDGKAHFKGVTAFDWTAESLHAGQDGAVSRHVAQTIAALSSSDAWLDEHGALRRWTADRLERTNAQVRGEACADEACLLGSYLGEFLPRAPPAADRAGVSPCLLSDSTAGRVYRGRPNGAAKRAAAERLFAEYYAALDGGAAGGGGGAPSGLRLPAGVPRGFGHLARLYASLAELHPFKEGNSRSRLLVLQTEMVRLGGHPLMEEEIGWGVYFATDPPMLEAKLLDGWCAYEYAARVGRSPFAAGHDYEYQSNHTCCAPAAASARGLDGELKPPRRPLDSAHSAHSREYMQGCAPLGRSRAFYDARRGRCEEVEAAAAEVGRLALGATRGPW